MPRIHTEISSDANDRSRLPDGLARYAAVITILRDLGVPEEVGERLRLPRRHGYAGLDLFLFLLCFFCQREARGLRPFRARFASHAKEVAALGGRSAWPTQASMSRALGCLSGEQVEVFGEWLLGRPLEDAELRDADEVLHTDASGRRWHVFDLDATVTPFRRRALPEDPELPEARRRADGDFARSGYSGRKRGEVQLARLVLQHAGSGCWLGSWAGPGNGDSRRAMARAADIAGRWRSPGAEVVLRFDGGLSGVPAMSACRHAGVHFLTRVAHYDWLQTDAAQAWLTAARWAPVADSGSGPKREAVDFGPAQLVGSRGGSAARERLPARIILSRFRNDGARRGAGVLLDGWQYEMYATDLPADGWPAAATVTAYYGRCGQENRFGQEDRELGLDRTFSYHLPGQHFACIVGLFLWNLESVLGARLVPLKATPSVAPSEPTVAEARHDAMSAEADDEPAHEPKPAAVEPESPPPELVRIDKRVLAAAATEALEEWSGGLSHAQWLDAHPGWAWDATVHRPRCPAGEPAKFHNARRLPGRVGVEFRVRYTACRDCPMRSSCTRSSRPNFRKEVVVRLMPGSVSSYGALEALARAAPGTRGTSRPAARPPRAPAPPLRSSVALDAAPAIVPGPRQPQRATLVPSLLRRKARDALTVRTCRVWLDIPEAELPATPWLATTAAQRQHRRHSHAANLLRFALPDSAHVRVDVDAALPLQRLVQPGPVRSIAV